MSDILIEAPNCYLSIPKLDHAQKLQVYYQENATFLEQWMPVAAANYKEIEQVQLYLRQVYWQIQQGLMCAFFFFFKQEHRLIGTINYNQIQRGILQSCTLGYSLAKAYTHQGLMSETLPFSNSFVFETLKLHRIEGYIMPDNLASISVVKKTGFRQEGIAYKYAFFKGQWRDHLQFSLLNPANQ